MNRRAVAVIALSIAGVFIVLAFIEYGKVLGTEEILKKLARRAGAAETCHTCTLETADERALFAGYSIIGGIAGAVGIALMTIKDGKIARMQ